MNRTPSTSRTGDSSTASGDNGSLPFASNAPGAAEFKAFLGKVQTAMPWRPNETIPTITYESRLEEKDRQYAAMVKRADELDKQRQEAEDLAKNNKGDLDEAQKVFAAKVDELQKKAVTDHSKREALIAHRTQMGPNQFFMRLPEELFSDVLGQETFQRVAGPGPTPERDLFAGLDV